MDDLNHFCVVSYQKVSSRNPIIFFSLDVGINVANEISRLSSTPLTTNLGRYLRTPSTHGHMSSSLYQQIIDLLGAKLEG